MRENAMDNTAKLLVMILLISFATERITAVVSYVMSVIPYLRHPRSSTARRWRRRGAQKILLTVLAGVFTAVVVDLADIRVLRLIESNVSPSLDYWLSWLVVFAGADRARDMLSGVKSPAPAPPKVPQFVLDFDKLKIERVER
jgi:hypothetical protein